MGVQDLKWCGHEINTIVKVMLMISLLDRGSFGTSSSALKPGRGPVF